MKLLILDSNSIFNRAFYGVKPLTTKDGRHTNAIFGFMNILGKLLTAEKPDRVIACFDMRAPTFRHKRYEAYKANRKGMPPELASQFEPLRSLLRAMGYPILEMAGYEADDLIGTLSRIGEERGDECVIATGDRDSLQLVSNRVTVRLAAPHGDDILYTPAVVMEKYGVEPPRLIDIKGLMGDSSDNIPGVAGIGEKTAISLITRFGDIDELYRQLADSDLRPAQKEKLAAGEEIARLSRELATIDRYVPLEKDPEELTLSPMDEEETYRILASLEMFSVISRLKLKQPEGYVPLSVSAEEEAPPRCETPACYPVVREPAPEEVLRVSKEAGGCDILLLSPVCIVITGGTLFLTMDGAAALLAALLPEERLPKRCYDAKTLHAFALRKGIPVRGLTFDALLAAYLLNPLSSDYSLERISAEYGVSAEKDSFSEAAEEVWAGRLLPTLCDALQGEITRCGMENLLGQIELPLARVLASMELDGFALDAEGLAAFGEELSAGIVAREEEIYTLAGERFNINSPKQLGEILFDRLGLPAKKKTKSGYSTNAEVLQSLMGKHPIIELILEYRKLAKLKSTYVEGLLKLCGEDGRIRTTFIQTETRTGRLSSAEPNLQNIPVRTELGSRMRKFFRAKPGYLLVDADYSQIELRVLAAVSEDRNMQTAFRNGVDIHTETASKVLGIPYELVTPQMRSNAKAVNFGIVYGIGAFSLSQDLHISVAEASRMIDNYLTTFSGVKQFMEDTVENAKRDGYVSTLFGRRRATPELTASNKMVQAAGKRLAMNTPIQGAAADIIKLAMIRVFDRLEREFPQSRLILQVHDELIVEAPQADAEAVLSLLREEMEAAATLAVPLRADGGIGPTWYDAK
ncbi:MAG: DNA polymerase I [Ruminococcaceae bacterium]|nr:DNA polymerase I [Oscillospiraceae bacterium]